MHVDGSCHCGAIHFSAEVDPGKVMICHCTDCQKLTGSAFRVVVPAAFSSMVLTGEPANYIKTSDSGVKRQQTFCPTCGTPLYSAALENPSQMSLRVGTLAQCDKLLPSLQIWTQSALQWVIDIEHIKKNVQQETLDLR